MLHGLLDRLLDPVAVRVQSDRASRHAQVEPDHEGVERDADRDRAHPPEWEVDQAEREQQDVGEHEEAVARGLDPVRSEIEELERGLEEQAGHEEEAPAHREVEQPAPATAGGDDDECSECHRQHEKPHARTLPTGSRPREHSDSAPTDHNYDQPVHEIRAEIPANVWQVVVEEGQLVAEGDEIVILESMKMEIPIITEVPGVVRELHVEPSDSVQEGDLIALIDES